MTRTTTNSREKYVRDVRNAAYVFNGGTYVLMSSGHPADITREAAILALGGPVTFSHLKFGAMPVYRLVNA